jgi:hypothetical protein
MTSGTNNAEEDRRIGRSKRKTERELRFSYTNFDKFILIKQPDEPRTYSHDRGSMITVTYNIQGNKEHPNIPRSSVYLSAFSPVWMCQTNRDMTIPIHVTTPIFRVILPSPLMLSVILR